jgi:membrane-associated phospholipid phosphatase
MMSPPPIRPEGRLADLLSRERMMFALRRRWGVVPVWVAGLAAVILLATTLDVIHHGALHSFDHTVARQMSRLDIRHRTWPMRLTYLLTLPGQRGAVLLFTVPIVGYLTWRSRSVAPLVRYAVALVLMTVAVYALKDWVARPAPAASATSHPGPPTSYPSGHVANAVLIWGVVWWSARELDPRMLLTRLLNWVRLFGPVLVAVGMTLLNYHWISDYIGGATVAVLLLAVITPAAWSRWCALADQRIWRIHEIV